MNSALLVLPRLLQNHQVWESPPTLSDTMDFFDADEIDRLAHAAWVREGCRPGREIACRREVEQQLRLSGLIAPPDSADVSEPAERHWASP